MTVAPRPQAFGRQHRDQYGGRATKSNPVGTTVRYWIGSALEATPGEPEECGTKDDDD